MSIVGSGEKIIASNTHQQARFEVRYFKKNSGEGLTLFSTSLLVRASRLRFGLCPPPRRHTMFVFFKIFQKNLRYIFRPIMIIYTPA